MTSAEFGLCAAAVFCTSVSQLFIKMATLRISLGRVCIFLGIGAALMFCSVFLAVMALRTMKLSQLVSFAACAYVLVPFGSRIFLGEQLLPRFWIGASLIVVGILFSNY